MEEKMRFEYESRIKELESYYQKVNYLLYILRKTVDYPVKDIK